MTTKIYFPFKIIKIIRTMSSAGSSSAGKKNRKHVAVSYDENDSRTDETNKKSKILPKNFTEMYEKIKIMRKDENAPVDSMGCEKCADPEATIEVQRYQILVALMLSSQTKDEITFQACQRLKNYGLTVENIAQSDELELQEIIKPVSFYKTKAKHIIQTAQLLREKHNSEVPNDFPALLALPGIGKKMANIILASCYDNIIGIGVDVHVHRLANRFNWVSSKTPEQTQQQLEKWLPFELWREINVLLVGFGQQICFAKNPKCGECLANDLCPYAFKDEKGKKKK